MARTGEGVPVRGRGLTRYVDDVESAGRCLGGPWTDNGKIR